MGYFFLFFRRLCWSGHVVPVFQMATLTLTRCCVTASRATNKGGTTCTTSAESPLGTMLCLTAGVDTFWGLCFLLWLSVDGSMHGVGVEGGGIKHPESNSYFSVFRPPKKLVLPLMWPSQLTGCKTSRKVMISPLCLDCIVWMCGGCLIRFG